MSESQIKAVPLEAEASDSVGFPSELPTVPYGEETPAGGEPVEGSE